MCKQTATAVENYIDLLLTF